MNTYLLLKWLHILSSTVLFGTGIGTASVFVFAHHTRDVKTIANVSRYVVTADWVFTGTSGIVQPLTGLLMVYLAGYSFTAFWIWGSIIGYLIAAFCWFPVVYLQIQMRNFASESLQNGMKLPDQYYQCYRLWISLGCPAFTSLIVVFYFMTTKL